MPFSSVALRFALAQAGAGRPVSWHELHGGTLHRPGMRPLGARQTPPVHISSRARPRDVRPAAGARDRARRVPGIPRMLSPATPPPGTAPSGCGPRRQSKRDAAPNSSYSIGSRYSKYYMPVMKAVPAACSAKPPWARRAGARHPRKSEAYFRRYCRPLSVPGFAPCTLIGRHWKAQDAVQVFFWASPNR